MTAVYLDPDTKITMTPRALVEVALDEDYLKDAQEFNKIVAYLMNKNKNPSIYPNPETTETAAVPLDKIEAFFWVPRNHKEIDEIYPEAPKCIKEAIVGVSLWHEKNHSEDYGFALIGFF